VIEVMVRTVVLSVKTRRATISFEFVVVIESAIVDARPCPLPLPS
jgi:hypothetical protein